MIPRPENPELARLVLKMFAAIAFLFVPAVAVTILTESWKWGFVVFGVGAVAIGTVFGQMLVGRNDAPIPLGRRVLSTVLPFVIGVGIVIYIAVRSNG